MFRKIISFFLVIAIFVSCFGLSSYANSLPGNTSAPSTVSFWGELINGIISENDNILPVWEAFDLMLNRTSGSCSASPDGCHNWDPSSELLGFYTFNCLYCNEPYSRNGNYQITDSDLEQAYQDAVAASGLSGIDNTGKLIFYPPTI